MSDFYGLPTRTLANPYLRVEVLAEAGPRVVRLFAKGSDQNLLAELPDVSWPTPLGEYHAHGGHRLWHAPEVMPRTYVPDDAGLTVREALDGVELIQPTEALTGLRKSLTVQLHRDQPALTLTHVLINEGVWPVEAAPWAITQLRLGGVVILPQPAGSASANTLLPNRHLVLWPYTRWADPRLSLHDDVILFWANPTSLPCKIGYLNAHGWAAYLWNDTLLVKEFRLWPGAAHPDRNCNVEVYGNHLFVELETLAPLTRLEPGQCVTHIETWRLFTGVRAEPTYTGVQALLQTLTLPAPDGGPSGVETL